MKTSCYIALLSVLITVLVSASPVAAQSTAFGYQGSLSENGNPANGSYDVEFSLYDALSGGAQLGPTITQNGVAVSGGSFAVTLNFGDQFTGVNRFLNIRVRQSGQPTFTTLTPRSQILSVPYAIKSANAESATTAANATQLGGVAAGQYVLTGDVRLSDARNPLPGSPNYIQNQNAAPQLSTNFSISGNGTAGGTLAGNTVMATNSFDMNAGGAVLYARGTSNNPSLPPTNTFVGILSGVPSPVQLNGFDNSAFGYASGAALTSGNSNAFFGSRSGLANDIGFSNSFFGSEAGFSTTSGNSNSFFGAGAGRLNSTGSGNSFIGISAGLANLTGNDNTFFGRHSGTVNSSGGANTFLGVFSGSGNDTGSNNSLLGYFSNTLQGGLNNATAIGWRAAVNQSNSLVLGSINGVNGATADTKVGIGTTTPTESLHVVGNGLFTGDLTVNGAFNFPSLTLSGNGFFNGFGGVGTTSDTFNGTQARFNVVQSNPNQWSQHIATNNSPLGGSFGLLIDAGTTSNDFPFRIRSHAGAVDLFSVRGDGNVGIGTDNPNSHLHLKVNAPGGFAMQMENTSTTKRLYIGNYGVTGGGNHWPGLDSANTSFLYSENNLVFTTPGGIYFSGSTTAEHMRIQSNGNIGMGSANPTEPLVISRNFGSSTALAVENTSSGSSKKLFLSNYGVNGSGNYWPGLDTAGTSSLSAQSPLVISSYNTMIFSATSTAEHMRITPTGNVGIGTQNPNAKLSISGSTAITVKDPATGFTKLTILGSGDLFAEMGEFSGLKANFGFSGGSTNVCHNTITRELGWCSSSLRYKTNVSQFNAGLNLIKRLKPITFDWKQGGMPDLGLGAEDVEAVEPLLVNYNRNGQVEGVKYDRIGVVLINAIKEQQGQIESLRAEIETLKQIVCLSNPTVSVCRK